MRIITLIFFFFILSLKAYAGVFFIKGNAANNADINEAAIYYNASVNNQTVTWLLSALSEIQGNYHNVKNVDIYLNSEGGDMDAGYVAYEALRKNPLKLNMINASMTESASTMIYCASDERYTMPLASFILHPAATSYDKNAYIKPDQARRIVEDAENYNSLFRDIYSSCTKIPAAELREITSSETNRVLYKADEAERKGLVTKGIKEEHSYLLTYYITDGQS